MSDQMQISNPISAQDITQIITALGDVALADIDWAESLRLPVNGTAFAEEAIYVICNSGMKNTVARGIYSRVMEALKSGQSATDAFKHKGKAAAIDRIWSERQQLYDAFIAADDYLQFLGDLPFIGNITKYHIAKNFGVDVAKPDVHLQRLADREGCSPQELCQRLAVATGYRVATIDTLLWRACANGLINSRAFMRTEAKGTLL